MCQLFNSMDNNVPVLFCLIYYYNTASKSRTELTQAFVKTPDKFGRGFQMWMSWSDTAHTSPHAGKQISIGIWEFFFLGIFL